MQTPESKFIKSHGDSPTQSDPLSQTLGLDASSGKLACELALSPFLLLVGTRAMRAMLSNVLNALLPRTVGHVGSLA